MFQLVGLQVSLFLILDSWRAVMRMLVNHCWHCSGCSDCWTFADFLFHFPSLHGGCLVCFAVPCCRRRFSQSGPSRADKRLFGRSGKVDVDVGSSLLESGKSCVRFSTLATTRETPKLTSFVASMQAARYLSTLCVKESISRCSGAVSNKTAFWICSRRCFDFSYGLR